MFREQTDSNHSAESCAGTCRFAPNRGVSQHTLQKYTSTNVVGEKELGVGLSIEVLFLDAWTRKTGGDFNWLQRRQFFHTPNFVLTQLTKEPLFEEPPKPPFLLPYGFLGVGAGLVTRREIFVHNSFGDYCVSMDSSLEGNISLSLFFTGIRNCASLCTQVARVPLQLDAELLHIHEERCIAIPNT